MNYRHAFHAGGPADVVKHAVLARILVHLRDKPAAFRVIDTHAGAGRYDLRGPEASRSPEWRDGIARLLTGPIDDKARALLAPYLDVVADLNAPGELAIYPGSPALVRALLRPQDRLVACELEPAPLLRWRAISAATGASRTVAIDGWVALNAYVPPPERRGLVLIDPPFERPTTNSLGSRRRSKRAPQMAKRHLSALVPDQGPAGAGCAGAPTAPLGDLEDPARRSRRSRRQRARAARRLRSDRGQSALDAGRRAWCDAAGAGAHFCRLLSRRLAKSAGPMTGADHSKAPCYLLFHSPGFGLFL